MLSVNLWNIVHLYRNKITFFILALFFLSFSAEAQMGKRGKEINNPNYDKRFVSYGFLLAIHTSNYKLEYSDAFATPENPLHNQYSLDQVHSVLPRWTTGFNLGFIVNFRFSDQFDTRLTPQVAFYEHHLDYRFLSNSSTNGPILVEQIIESTLVEFPLLLKYKSERRGNTRVYLLTGVKPGIEVSGKNQIQSGNETLDIREGNLSVEVGAGLDIYFPLFKFSPEIRYSRGLTNLHRNLENQYSASIRELNTNTITLYFLFQ